MNSSTSSPSIEVYYDPSRLPLPAVVGWLRELGIDAVHRTPSEAPAEWMQRYGCCFPWVVANGRLVLKAGFQREHLVRLAQRWYGAALVLWWRAPSRVPQEIVSQSGQGEDLVNCGVNSYHPNTPTTFQNQQIWDGASACVSDLSELLLRNFRLGYRTIVVWNDPDTPPPEPLTQRAIEELQCHDVVFISTSNSKVSMLGIRAWHGELFQGLDDMSPIEFMSLAAKANDLKLDVSLLHFDEMHTLSVAPQTQKRWEE